MIPRLYLSQPLKKGLCIDPDEGIRRYLLRTLRLKPGATLILFNGKEHGEWQAQLKAAPLGQIEVQDYTAKQRESPLSITLVQGVAKTDAMEFTVQKSIELGVSRILFLLCHRCRSNSGSDLTPNRQRRLQRIAIEAAEQSGRLMVPNISEPLSWQQLGNHLDSGPRLLFWEENHNQSGLLNQHALFTQPESIQPESIQTLPSKTITLLVGPEGGLEPDEVSFAQQHLNFSSMSLGQRILRTETAALAVITSCQLLWGDLGSGTFE